MRIVRHVVMVTHLGNGEFVPTPKRAAENARDLNDLYLEGWNVDEVRPYQPLGVFQGFQVLLSIE